MTPGVLIISIVTSPRSDCNIISRGHIKHQLLSLPLVVMLCCFLDLMGVNTPCNVLSSNPCSVWGTTPPTAHRIPISYHLYHVTCHLQPTTSVSVCLDLYVCVCVSISVHVCVSVCENVPVAADAEAAVFPSGGGAGTSLPSPLRRRPPAAGSL